MPQASHDARVELDVVVVAGKALAETVQPRLPLGIVMDRPLEPLAEARCVHREPGCHAALVAVAADHAVGVRAGDVAEPGDEDSVGTPWRAVPRHCGPETWHRPADRRPVHVVHQVVPQRAAGISQAALGRIEENPVDSSVDAAEQHDLSPDFPDGSCGPVQIGDARCQARGTVRGDVRDHGIGYGRQAPGLSRSFDRREWAREVGVRDAASIARPAVMTGGRPWWLAVITADRPIVTRRPKRASTALFRARSPQVNPIGGR